MLLWGSFAPETPQPQPSLCTAPCKYVQLTPALSAPGIWKWGEIWKEDIVK